MNCRRLLAVLAWNVFWAGISLPAAHADDAPLSVARLLLPQIRDWRPLDRSNLLSGAALKMREERLRAAYRRFAAGRDELESPACSVLERIFVAADGEDFHRLDIDGDGLDDIVYAGSAQCREGELSLVWFGHGADYEIRQPVPWPVRFLAVDAQGRNYASISPGCCGDPIDTYLVGSLDNIRQMGALRVSKALHLPLHAGAAGKFRSPHALALRETPQRHDGYDESRSQFMRHAVFGNVLRRYLPGATGWVVAAEMHAGHCWQFVVLDAAADVLVTESPYDVGAGWVKAATRDACRP